MRSLLVGILAITLGIILASCYPEKSEDKRITFENIQAGFGARDQWLGGHEERLQAIEKKLGIKKKEEAKVKK